MHAGDFPGGPVVKNLPCNAGDAGLSSGQGTKIPQTVEQVSHKRATARETCTAGRIPHDTRKIRHAATKAWHNQINKY